MDSDDDEVVEGVQPPVATKESYHMSGHPVRISKQRATGIGICCDSHVSQEEISQCQGMSETGDVLHPSTHRAPMYLWNGHSRG